MSVPQPSSEQLRWEKSCSVHVTSDVIWNLLAFRAALFLLHCVQEDLEFVKAAPDLKDQLIRAAGAVGADLSEGYSRATRADRVRYYGYSLGSIRECMVWYLSLRGRLPDETLEERLGLTSRTRALVLGLIKSSRTANPPRGRFEK